MKRGLVFAAVLLAASCGIESGSVTARTYEDPYVEQIWLCVVYMANGTCASMMPFDSHVPECWRINFSDGQDENSACVGRSTWDSFKVGDHFDINTVEVS